ncbi:MAG: carboxypeptidase regulatory-like domain-containing protein [Gemmatimonadaceae bacterium]
MTLRRLCSAVALFVGLIILGSIPRAAAAQDGADIIRGRVIGPDSQPINGVIVTATSVSGNVSRRARTGRDGRFTIAFPGGDGDYFVSYQAIGYAPRRFQVKRTADQDILVADARLSIAAQTLDTVQITGGDRARVNRNDNPQDISGTERAVNNSALSAEQQGDLAAMAASLPGVQFIPGADGDPSGFSVLGLTSDQNTTTLNGLNSGATNLPRDAAVSSSLVTTPYDVSRGGFSGGQFNVRSRSGSNFLTRSSSLNLDGPALQWTDPAARALNQEYSNLSLGGSMSGPMKFDESFYNLSFQVGRRGNDLNTLLNTSALGLQAAGVAQDSVARLLNILNAAQVPVSVGGIPGARNNDNLIVFGALDWAPPSSLSGQALNVTFNANLSQQVPATALTSATPAFSGERINASGGIQMRHTGFFGIFLSETNLGASLLSQDADPYLNLPSGSVLVNSTFADGSNGVSNIAFGGNPNLNTLNHTNNIGFNNLLSWFSENNRHRLKLTTELRRDGYSSLQNANLLGSFRFNSLVDLENNVPASFSRALSPRLRTASQWIGGVSLGDSWRVNPNFQLQYGVRADGNQFVDRPDFNPLVLSTFGVRNDELPNRVLVSPRMGFSWTYGDAPQIPGFEGAVRGPRAVVRGGVGLFQNSPQTRLTGNALDLTGLPSGIQNLSCAGAAAPAPDWSTYSADPSQIPVLCADGSSGTVFSNSRPNVSLFSSDFAPQRSLRSNVQWNGPILANRFTATIEATYSLNQNQQSSVDLNFNPAQRFALPEEDSRPVYVQATSIVPLNGAIAPGDNRISTLFNRVTKTVSDLDGVSRQISLRLTPTRFSTGFTYSAAYVYSSNREQIRGFQNTGGDPRTVEWTRSSFDTRHQISYNLGYNFFDAVRVNWSGSFRSGNPYTPVVSGDVNGDGYNNDRAFIFDPATATDPAVATAMQALLASTSGGARECLRAQFGRIAGRNSCEGPWTQSAVLTMSFNPLKFRLPQRATLSVNVSNPLAAADMLIHGENNTKGWGQANTPDAALLYVRGFNPGTQTFRYDVNQRFGNIDPQLSAIRAPVAVTVQLRFDLGPTRERQLLIQALDRGRTTTGSKAREPQLRAQYGNAGLPNPMATILRQADTLDLQSAQADSLATMNRWYLIRLDSIWSPLTKELAALPDNYNREQVYEKYTKARQGSVDLLIKLAPRMNALLSKEQKRKLPAFIASYLDLRYLASIRNGTAGTGFGLPGGFTPGAIGGGGGATVIRRQ